MRSIFWCTLLLLSASALQAAETTAIPVLKGESLPAALRRVHPCFDAPGVKIPAEVMSDNPEHVGRDGAMTLVNPVLRLPTSFLDPKTQCGPIAQGETKAAESKAELQPAPHFRGGPELRPHHEEAAEKSEEPKEQGKEAKGEREEEHESPYKNHVTVLGLVDYSRMAATVNATGAMPIFVSNPQPGFELVYSRELSPEWSVGFNYLYLSTSFQDIDGLPFTELTSVLQEFAFSARYRITHTSRISLQIGGAQVDELSISPVDGSLLIDHTFRITGTFLFLQELGKIAGFEVIAGLGAQTFIPTDWSQDSVGVGELFRLLFERDLSQRWAIEFGALGSYERQETQSESHSELSVAFGLGLSFRF